jgi:hypothetical protein
MGLFFASAKVHLQNISLSWRVRMDMRWHVRKIMAFMSAHAVINALAAIRASAYKYQVEKITFSLN